MIKFSIIVPFYNGFDKIIKLFNSLKIQTYKNFEVIIVDDMSSDNSYENLSESIKQTKLDIKLFRNDINSGPGIARNTGISHCQGDYILFIDCDDYIHKESLSKLNEIITKKAYDLVLFDSYFVKNDKQSLAEFNYGLVEGENDIRKVLVQAMGITQGKCYKVSIIKENNINFLSIKRGEDSPFFREAVSYCKNIYYLKKPLYYYVQNNESLMHQEDRCSIEDIEQAFNQIQNALKNNYSYELLQLSSREYIYTTICNMIESKFSIKEINEKIEEFNRNYKNWYKESLSYSKKRYLSIILWCIYGKHILIIKLLLKVRNILIKYKR